MAGTTLIIANSIETAAPFKGTSRAPTGPPAKARVRSRQPATQRNPQPRTRAAAAAPHSPGQPKDVLTRIKARAKLLKKDANTTTGEKA